MFSAHLRGVAVCRARLERRAGVNRICGWDSQSAGGTEWDTTREWWGHKTQLSGEKNTANAETLCDRTHSWSCCCPSRRRWRIFLWGWLDWGIMGMARGSEGGLWGVPHGGGAGATDEGKTNGSMTIMNKVGRFLFNHHRRIQQQSVKWTVEAMVWQKKRSCS